MKKLTMFLLVIGLILSPIVSAFASSSAENTITRGQFFKLIVDQLGYDDITESVQLPPDVTVNSPYADAIKILKEKKIVVGFEDGTFRPDQKISPLEAANILARLLAIKGDAQSVLETEFGFGFSKDSTITLEQAEKMISNTLSSDQKALELVEKMTVAQQNVKSFQANTTMSMEYQLADEIIEQQGFSGNVKINSNVEMRFNKEKGMYQQIVTQLPPSSPNTEQEMKIEQYFVPEGMFIKVPNPITGEEQWLNISDSMPLSFEDIMNMNKENMNVMKELNRQNFFYKYIGSEKLDGRSLQKITVRGKIHSTKDVMEIMSKVLKDQSGSMLASFEKLPEMSLAINGTIWIDERTSLPARQVIQYDILYGKSGDAFTLPMPIKSLNYEMDLRYSNFNKIVDIALPVEAKNAEKVPSADRASIEKESNKKF